MTTAVEQIESAPVTPEPPFLTRVRLRARRRALWLKALWSAEPAGGQMAITPEEVERHLAEPGSLTRTEAHFYDTDPQARSLSAKIEAIDELLEDHKRWQRLRTV